MQTENIYLDDEDGDRVFRIILGWITFIEDAALRCHPRRCRGGGLRGGSPGDDRSDDAGHDCALTNCYFLGAVDDQDVLRMSSPSELGDAEMIERVDHARGCRVAVKILCFKWHRLKYLRESAEACACLHPLWEWSVRLVHVVWSAFVHVEEVWCCEKVIVYAKGKLKVGVFL